MYTKHYIATTLGGAVALASAATWAGCDFFGPLKDTDPRYVENYNKFSDSCVANGQHPKTKQQKGPARDGKTLYTVTLLYCCDKATDEP